MVEYGVINAKEKVETEIVKTITFTKMKTIVTIEAVLSGFYKGKVIVRSKSKRLFGYKPSVFASSNIQTDFWTSEKIVNIQYPVFDNIDDAIRYKDYLVNKYKEKRKKGEIIIK